MGTTSPSPPPAAAPPAPPQASPPAATPTTVPNPPPPSDEASATTKTASLSATNPINGSAAASLEPRTIFTRSAASKRQKEATNTAIREAKTHVRAKLREDWEFPLPESCSLAEVLKGREDDTHWVSRLSDSEVIHDSSSEEETEQRPPQEQQEPSHPPHQWHNPEPFTTSDNKSISPSTKKRKRQDRIMDEMAWNEGFAHWVRQRDAWTAAKALDLKPPQSLHPEPAPSPTPPPSVEMLDMTSPRTSIPRPDHPQHSPPPATLLPPDRSTGHTRSKSTALSPPDTRPSRSTSASEQSVNSDLTSVSSILSRTSALSGPASDTSPPSSVSYDSTKRSLARLRLPSFTFPAVVDQHLSINLAALDLARTTPLDPSAIPLPLTGPPSPSANTITNDDHASTPASSAPSPNPSSPSPPSLSHTPATHIPIPPPLLPSTNPVRASITPATYPALYSKIAIQGLTPTMPINLADMVRALVAGWKRDGDWPPRSDHNAAADTAIQNRNAPASTAGAAPVSGLVRGKGLSLGLGVERDEHGHSHGHGHKPSRVVRRSVGKVKRALGIGSGSGSTGAAAGTGIGHDGEGDTAGVKEGEAVAAGEGNERNEAPTTALSLVEDNNNDDHGK